MQLPVFEGDAATVRQANQELLTTCARGAGLLRGRGRGVEANDGN